MRTIEQVQADMQAYTGKKTTKGYRMLKEELKSITDAPRGLGDVVETITKATGIKAIVDALPFDCGCEERKQEWNKITLESIKSIFKRNKVVNEISVEDYAYLCDFFKDGMPNQVSREQQIQLHGVYKNVFNIQKAGTSCSPCLKSTIKELYKLYELNSK
tara:strand:+ start:1232 stop:1711 length:480 start_codon:yes stop_codon:yes gene_type:complete